MKTDVMLIILISILGVSLHLHWIIPVYEWYQEPVPGLSFGNSDTGWYYDGVEWRYVYDGVEIESPFFDYKKADVDTTNVILLLDPGVDYNSNITFSGTTFEDEEEMNK